MLSEYHDVKDILNKNNINSPFFEQLDISPISSDPVQCNSNLNLYNCGKCSCVFTNKITLLMHIKDIHSIGSTHFPCVFCDKIFNDSWSRSNHIRVHLRQKELTCQQCGKTLQNQKMFNIHVKRHKPIKPTFKCDNCENLKVKRTFSDLDCDKCGKVYKRKSYLEKHKKQVHHLIDNKHCGNDSNFQCDKCGKVFKWKNHLLAHIRHIHHYCDRCGKGIKQKVYSR